MKIPELLAPVGSMEHLKIAINAGASSVYLSGKKYGARKFAENFTIEEIKEAVKISHLHNVKVYVTVNTLIKENELEEVLDYINELYSIGIDAVIVQDIGLIRLINKYIPNMRIHASTQLNIENQNKLDYLKELNVKRVILPRELHKNEIKNLKTNLETEIFAHGALCYSYSGQCLFSSFKGGRSGNRGSCAQPCRQKYKLKNSNNENYYLSPKDLSLINNLEDITYLNIDSIKIEGRMRSKEYLAIVISEYRKALNKIKSKKHYNSEEINLVFNRGLTEGHFMNKPSRSIRPGHTGLPIGEVYKFENNQIVIKLKDSINTIPEKGDGLLIINGKNSYGFEISQDPILTTENHFNKGKIKVLKDKNRIDRILIIKKVKQNKRINFDLNHSKVFLTKRNKIDKKTKEIENEYESFIKSKLRLSFSVRSNYPLLKGVLRLPNKKEIKAEIIGEIPFEKAINKPLTKESIANQLSKLGNSPFKIETININYNENLFLPIKEINKIRRELLEKLENQVINSYEHEKVKVDYNNEYGTEKNEKNNNKIKISYYCNDLEVLKDIENVERVYLEIPPDNSEGKININYMVNFLEKAHKISLDKNFKLIWKWPDIAHDNLIKILNKVNGILKKMGITYEIMSPNYMSEYGPYSLNIRNSETIKQLNNYKLLTLSVELSKGELKEIMNHTDNNKIEVLVQGNIELMKSRYKLIYENEIKDNEIIIEDKNFNNYNIKKNLSKDEWIILNNEDLSLLEEIPYLKSINIKNISIDGRWKGKNYLKMIEIYSDALDGNINKKRISQKYTKGNF